MLSKFSKKDSTTHGFSVPHHDIDVVVGDEKQSAFFPRLKIKKWNNESNFSIGLANTTGTVKSNSNRITFQTAEVMAVFEPNLHVRKTDDTAIRYIDSGRVSPIRISSLYELDRYHEWSKQTVVVHRPNQLMLGYFGMYPKTQYVDPKLVDIPECRLSALTAKPTDPMAVDDTMWLIDIHYDPHRDDMKKIHSSMVKAIISIMAKYGINSVTGSEDYFKLYFTDNGKKVKFLSCGFFDGHYYLYVNLGFDYHLMHKYLKKDLTPPTKDKYAYGLRSVREIPNKSIDEIIEQYAINYGVPLQRDDFTLQEKRTLNYLDKILGDKEWIDNAKRREAILPGPSWESGAEGINMDFEFATRPSSNVIELTLRSKNLLYFRQNEEPNPYVIRPPYVIGSYAVYHAEGKKDNKYKTGKAFHIYRPWAEDANKKRVWCELHIPTNKNGELTGENATITIPKDFLDNATYPVFVDPTLGYESVGASAITTDYSILGSIFTNSANIKITSISTYYNMINGSNNTVYYRMGAYNAATNSLIAQTTQGSTTIGSLSGFFTLSFSSPADVALNTQVVLCAAMNGSNTGYGITAQMYYDTDASVTSKTSSSVYGTSGGSFPNPVTWTSTENRKYSIYANYDNVLTISEDTTKTTGVKVLPPGFPK